MATLMCKKKTDFKENDRPKRKSVQMDIHFIVVMNPVIIRFLIAFFVEKTLRHVVTETMNKAVLESPFT